MGHSWQWRSKPGGQVWNYLSSGFSWKPTTQSALHYFKIYFYRTSDIGFWLLLTGEGRQRRRDVHGIHWRGTFVAEESSETAMSLSNCHFRVCCFESFVCVYSLCYGMARQTTACRSHAACMVYMYLCCPKSFLHVSINLNFPPRYSWKKSRIHSYEYRYNMVMWLT